MFRIFLGYAMLLPLLMGCAHVSVAADDSVNVKDLGARGDGQADDTQAFIDAVAQGATEKKPVYVPMGIYRISQTIALEKITLAGPEGAAWPADVETMPKIIPTHRDSPAFELKEGAALGGLDITYNWSDEPTTGPAAVLITGIGAYVHNLRIRYAWDGIIADGDNNIGRLNIDNVFMVSIRNVGVRVTGTWDVPRLNNIEVWNAGPVPHGLSDGVGFVLGKNDLIRLTDCFVFAMNKGYLFSDEIEGCSIDGVTWGVMNGCSTDFCSVGIDVQGDHTLSVSGGSFWQHHTSLRVNGAGARVRMSGSELKSNGAPVIQVIDSAQTVVTGCTLLRNFDGVKGVAGVLLEGGHTVLTGNHIDTFGNGVEIRSGVQAALVQGNMIDSHGYKDIDDTHSPNTDVLVSGNLPLTHSAAVKKAEAFK